MENLYCKKLFDFEMHLSQNKTLKKKMLMHRRERKFEQNMIMNKINMITISAILLTALLI